MLLKNLRPSAVVSEQFQNALPMQRLYNLRVTHQAQVTRRGLSYEAVFLSSTSIPGETFHCKKMSAVVQKGRESEGLFDKEPAPSLPEIHNLTAPPYYPGYPIETGVLNSPNCA